MGKQGFWKNEGYVIKPASSSDDVSDGNDWLILMISPDKERAAELRVYMDRSTNYLRASSIYVREDHRRKGIASALYDYAEEVLGKKMRPANECSEDPDDFSDDAAAFWSKR